MGIRISSIQSRDQVEVKSMPETKTQMINTGDPFPKGVTKPLEDYADFLDKKQAEALRNAQNVRSAMIKNKFADFASEATMRVMEAEGENTFKAGDEAGKQLKKNITKELEKVPAEYRTEYANFGNDSISKFNRTAQGRMITEGRKAGEVAFKKRAEDLTSQAVLAAYDPEEFEISLRELDATTEQHSQLTIGGESPRAKEVMEQQKKAARSTVIMKTVETLSASGDVAKASQIAQTYKKTLSAEDLAKTYKILSDGKVKRDLDTAKSESDTLFERYGTNERAAAADVAKNIQDGRLARDILTNYSARVAADRRYEDRSRKETFGDIQSQIIKTGQFTPEMGAKLSPVDYQRAMSLYVKVSRGELVPRNHRVWNAQLAMYIAEPSKFKTQNFSHLQDQLPNTDVNKLMNLQKQLLESVPEKFTPKGSNHILNKWLRTITAPPGSSKKIQQEAAMRDAFLTAFENARANLGERGTQADIDKQIELDMAQYNIKYKDQRNPLKRFFGIGEPDMQAQPSAAQKGAKNFNSGAPPVAFSTYPSEAVTKVRSYMKTKVGREATDQEVLKALSKLREQGKL